MVRIIGVVTLAACVIMSLALYSYRKKKATTWVVTKGTLSATQGYRSSMINYSVNGRTITHKMINPPFNAVDGEQYIVHYDSANPNEYEVEFWNPIFSESEQTSTIIGTISRGPFSYKPGLFAIEFTYQVGDSAYMRGQKLPPTYRGSGKKIAVGQMYSVEYQVGYASRAVIHLDTELK